MERKKILLVDDDSSLLTLLSIRLRAAGFEIEKAHNGQQALAIALRERPHLVITDMRMEGMDGMNLFSRLQELYPWLPVIILTAQGSAAEAAAARRRGVFAYVTKPFDSVALVAQVEQALQHGCSPIVSGLAQPAK